MDDKLKPADPHDLISTLAFALLYSGRKRVHNADIFMSDLVARRLVEHLDRAGFVVMKKPTLQGHSNLGRGALDRETEREKGL